ncbi:MAG: protein kinase, partial [Planctomycetales bacterium]
GIKLLDLGIARMARSNTSNLTMIGGQAMLGTVDYLAPEQALDAHTVDSRADIYSLGCTLYFLLTGHAPFPEGTQAQRLLAHQVQAPASIAGQRSDAPPELVAICERMMAKEMEERFPNAADVADALRNWQREYVKATGNADIPCTGRDSARRASLADPDTKFTIPVQKPST